MNQKLQLFEVAQMLTEIAQFYQSQKTGDRYDPSNGTLFGVSNTLYVWDNNFKRGDAFLNGLAETNRTSGYDLKREDLLHVVEEEYVDHMVARLDEMKADYKNHYEKDGAV